MKVSIRNLLLFFLFAVYPIIPRYFGIAGISAFKLMCLGIVVIACLFLKVNKSLLITCKGVVIAFGIWLLVMLLNMIQTGDLIEYAYEVLCYYLVGVVALCCLNTRDRFVWAIDLIIYGATVASLIGIIESITGFNCFHMLNTMNAQITLQPLRFGFQRIISFTYQTISFCNYCMFALGLIFYRISICSNRNDKSMKFKAAYCIVLLAAVMTLSRSILLCIIASQLILLYLCGYKTFIKRILVISFVGAAIIAICTFIFPDVAVVLQSMSYMLLALFNDNYASLLGNVDGTGIGDRQNLITWVWQSMDNKWFGMGGTTDFAYSYEEKSGIYTYIRTKTSIENQYLNLLYHYGIIGLVSMVWAYLQLLLIAVKHSLMKSSEWEGRISFSKVTSVIFLTYYVSFFGVHQIDEKRIFFCWIFLMIAYYANGMYSKKQNS